VTSVIVPEGNGRWVEYAGGYSDMLAQRGSDLRQKTTKASPTTDAKPARAAASSNTTRRRLSFNEKHALETLPKTMAKLQQDIATWQSQLDDPTLFTRDRRAFDKASTDIAKAHSELEAAEEKWLELEMLREEIESGS
jgi:ATP-binding cassette subfamily F protein uup